jgi:hypothetical protein
MAHKMTPELEAAWQKAITKAWDDAKFKRALIDDPRKTLEKEGVKIPQGLNLVVVENEADRVHLVLPAKPSTLSVEKMDRSAISDYDPGF